MLVGAHTSLLGFNHSFEPDRPVCKQPTTSKGITIGKDVWIGSHVVVGAGAVVTKDAPHWAVAGDPARMIQDRREARRTTTPYLPARLVAFGETARAQAVDVMDRYWLPARGPDEGSAVNALGGRFVDRPDAKPTVRASGATPPRSPTCWSAGPGQRC